MAVGVPLGLAAIALVAYVLRRRRRHLQKTGEPESSTGADSAIYQKAELDAQSGWVPKAELDAQSEAIATSELDAQPDPRSKTDIDSNAVAELPSTCLEPDEPLGLLHELPTTELADDEANRGRTMYGGGRTLDAQVEDPDEISQQDEDKDDIGWQSVSNETEASQHVSKASESSHLLGYVEASDKSDEE